MADPSNPLIVQSDKTVLLEVAHPLYEAARDALARFAELERSPEHIHTYRLTPLSLWNAASAGLSALEITDTLAKFAKYEIPDNVTADLLDAVARYGRVTLEKGGEGTLRLAADTEALFLQLRGHKKIAPYLKDEAGPRAAFVLAEDRGLLKQALLEIGFPADDRAGYQDGAPLLIRMRETTRSGLPFTLRGYQREAVDVFHAGGSERGGSGVLVLPCGAGKTLIGIGAMERLATKTLILVTNITAARQWRDEIIERTTLTEDQIGEYSGETKEIRPVTIATYQILLSRRGRGQAANAPGDYPHFKLFNSENWGLILYDEVHLLPAPVFRITAGLQARRRLGLTATLIREDGKEGDVFTLIGPKRYDAPWKKLEREGWIATGYCHEVRVPLAGDQRLAYAVADDKDRHRIAATNPLKLPVAQALIDRHPGESVLVIGQYLEQLDEFAKGLDAPILTGKTPNAVRAKLYREFKEGKRRVLVVSKVANFAVDLPNAAVAIQISGTYGSRQEEAQRLGRVLRPKEDANTAHFYTLVSKDTCDQDFAMKRQRFLTEQGYRYSIESWNPENVVA